MKNYNFDAFIDRNRTASLKWDTYKGKDIIPLWVADMDFKSPDVVIEALKQRSEHGIYGYTLPPEELYEVVISRLKQKYGWHIKKDWLVWLPGLVSGINIACRAVGSEGDEVMTVTPAYPPFLTAPDNMNRTLVTSLMISDQNSWIMDMDDLRSKVTSRTKLFLLCSPHNPTGRIFSRRELSDFIEFCVENDIIICSDEIHCDIILNETTQHVPTAAFSSEAADRTITLMAPSKTYNIAGLGCSFAVIPNSSLRQSFRKAMEGIVPHVNLMGYTAALAAYKYGHTWLTEVLAYLKKNHDYVYSSIKGMNFLHMYPAQGTYLAWINAAAIEKKNPAAFFEQYGLGFSDGYDFGEKNFIRLNFGCPRFLLEKAIDRLHHSLKNL
ncbi:MAG: PatB family C-S lyase [bacterium]